MNTKNLITPIGYAAAAAIMCAAVFKFNHLPGTGTVLAITGLIIGIFFAAYVLDRMNEVPGETSAVSVAGAISVLFLNTGITCRIWHWPGANILLTLGLTGFALVFIPMCWLKRSKESNQDDLRNSAGALGLSLFAIGALFKLMHWPGAIAMMALSPMLIFLVFYPRYIMDKSIDAAQKKIYLRDSFLTIVIGTLVALYFVKSIEIHDLDKILQAITSCAGSPTTC
jgi:hypothetical protein